MEKFTCYFCNKTIGNETQLGHMSLCGSVLLPCPNKCGSYVPRMDLKKHRNDCLNRGPSAHQPPQPPKVPTTSLDRSQNNYKKLQDQLQNLEQYITTLEKLEKSQKLFEIQVEHLKQSVENLEKSRQEHNYHWQNFQKQIITIDQLCLDVNHLTTTNQKTKTTNDKIFIELATNLEQIKGDCKLENAQIAELWNDHSTEIEKILTNVNKIQTQIEEQKIKTASILFDVKTCNRMVEEGTEKIEILERDFHDIQTKLTNIEGDLELIEGDVARKDSINVGELLWVITEFQEKLERTKSKDNLVRKGSVFYSHKYGYKIRLLLYLNGLKKWKGRYALLTVQVLRGEYDLLQKWPCDINGTITLKDLENSEDPKDLKKLISAKRQYGGEENEEPQESSSSYIFIPHSTLTKEKYLKNDTIIIHFK